MLQAIGRNNKTAVEILLAMGCNPEVATYNGDHAVTNVVNIREKSAVDNEQGVVNHVCILGRNEHIEQAITDTTSRECASFETKKTQMKMLHMQVDAELKNKQISLENETLSSKYEAFEVKKEGDWC